jgi:hypothetical protein
MSGRKVLGGEGGFESFVEANSFSGTANNKMDGDDDRRRRYICRIVYLTVLCTFTVSENSTQPQLLFRRGFLRISMRGYNLDLKRESHIVFQSSV